MRISFLQNTLACSFLVARNTLWPYCLLAVETSNRCLLYKTSFKLLHPCHMSSIRRLCLVRCFNIVSSVQIALIHHALSSRNVPRICCFFCLQNAPQHDSSSLNIPHTCCFFPVKCAQHAVSWRYNTFNPAPTIATCDDYAIFYLQKRPKYVVSSAKRLSTCNFVSRYALNTTSLLLLNMQFLPCKIPPACIRCRNCRRLAATVI